MGVMYTLPLKFLNASVPANFTERLCFENKTVVLNVSFQLLHGFYFLLNGSLPFGTEN